MSPIEREQLLGYVLGALDEDEHRHVDARLRREADLRRNLESVRRSLRPLQSMRRAYEPPEGLAGRTCQMVSRHQERAAALPSLAPCSTLPRWGHGLRFADLAVAAAVCLAVTAILIPALQSSRFNAQILTCQDKLRQIGVALTQYSDRNGGYFPVVPQRGALASAGIYAPVLLDHGLLKESAQVVCPGSPLAEDRQFQVPPLAEVRLASDDGGQDIRRKMGGSYGYSLGYVHDGVYRPTKNRHRPTFALLADSPSAEMPELRSVNHAGKGQNVLFEDGHVSFLSSPSVPSSPDCYFTNDDGRIAAGVHPDDSVIVSSTTCPLVSDGD